ncbi:sterigmatocystin biosynthesis P450 monooxygenase [Apiospora marii]|uniref:Sterigmatocystin biosynthesis P450 monooxygenase n=1 Tax=Apiospora marii TaxID=335849 RepID=A0ABR1RD14_9PEZI
MLSYNYAAVALALSAGYLLYAVYKALRNPLNAIPGAWHAKFTTLPATLASLSRQQVQYYHRLHERFGPFVRTGPCQVFVANIDAYKAIHRVGGRFFKTDLYHYFGPTEAGKPPYGIFQMTDPVAHAQRRKLLGPGFTATSLRREWEGMVTEKVAAAVEGMRGEARGSAVGEVDVRKWWNLMASDVVSTIMFGRSFDSLKAGRMDPWFDDIKIASVAAFGALSFPWLYEVLKRLPLIGRWRYFHAHKSLMAKGMAAVENSRAKTAAGPDSTTANIFAKVLREADPVEGGSLTDADIAVEAGAFMVAGTDTTSNTLTYLVWAVLSNDEGDLQGVLEQELQEKVEGGPSGIIDAALEKLPVLNAVIEETLRLFGAAPIPLPRIVPPGGVEFGGYHLPAGTEVATQAYTMHRDPRFFADPERFDHTRWLPGGDCTTSETSRTAFGPFGAGSRGCIGKHLAYMELRLGAAAFFRAFRGCRLAASVTPESMHMDNLVLMEPRGKTLKVVMPEGAL